MKNTLTLIPKEKSAEAKSNRMSLRKLYGIPPMSKAIRKKCLECVCGSANEVKKCHISGCPLFPFRFGRNPRADDLKVPEFNNTGECIGYSEYKGWNADLPWGGSQEEK